MLKNAPEATLVPKNVLFLKILNFVQSFVESKVSLADGMTINLQVVHFLYERQERRRGRKGVIDRKTEIER
jgi:hypothetical protein